MATTPPQSHARKEPLAFADLCHECGVAHPDTSLTRPPDPTHWLAKRPGGAGGRHIRDAADSECTGGSFYFQRRVQGSPVSALFLADGRRTMVLGFSAQWSAPTASQPFRYGGAVQPAVLEPETAAAMNEAVQRLGAMVPLRGLNSADFLVSGDVFTLLEINPRPGATLDIFEPAEAVTVRDARFSLPRRAAGNAAELRASEGSGHCLCRPQHSRVSCA